MTREEQINKEVAHYLFEDFKPTGVITEERFAIGVHMANWADAHPKNPWRDARTDPPKDELVGEKVLILTKRGGWYKGYYSGVMWYYQDECGDEIRTFDVNYWMPIPELPEGGEA